MRFQKTMVRSTLFFGPLALVAVTLSVCQAQSPRPRQELREPIYRVQHADGAAATVDARQSTPTPPGSQVRPVANEVAEHPLMAAVRVAEKGLKNIQENIDDYSCTLVKRECIDGDLQEPQYIYMKVRNEKKDATGAVTTPLSVYMYFLAPDNIKGREVIWVKGQNENKLVAHEGGAVMGLVTVNLDPESRLAMRNQKYPIYEVGIQRLIEKLLDVAAEDMKYGECEVKFFEGSKINGIECTCIQVVHPVPRKNFRFHIARIFFDSEREVPIRYASYDWPKEAGGEPTLHEEYTYLNMKLNRGFTDEDFSKDNPKYNFR